MILLDSIMARLAQVLRLDTGSHSKPSAGLCLLEAVAFVAGEAHSDTPVCACPVIGAYGRRLNDRLPDTERQQLLPYIARLVGSRSTREVEQRRAYLAADRAVRIFAPLALEAAGLTAQAATLRALPEIEDEQTAASADVAAAAARAAGDAAEAAADVATADARAADARAAAAAAARAAADAADVATADARAADARAAAATDAAARAAAYAAANAAAYAAAAANDAANAARAAAAAAANDAANAAANAYAYAAAATASAEIRTRLVAESVRLLSDMLDIRGEVAA